MWEAEEVGKAGIKTRAQRQAVVMTNHMGESTNDEALQFYLRLRPHAEVAPFPELDRSHLHSTSSDIEFD